MPRNVSGTYSLYTPGNPVVPSTVITTTWANNTLSDLATAMTDSLSRSGNGGMSAPLQLAAGAIGAPGLTWSAETTSGWYRAGAGDFRYSVSGADKLTITASLISTAGNFTVGGGALIGAATGGNQGTGTINATAVYDDGVLLANSSGANPTGTVGLTAVNGAAATFLRSDGAPALSQSISPNWTGTHSWAVNTFLTLKTAGGQNGILTEENAAGTGNLLLQSGGGSGGFGGGIVLYAHSHASQPGAVWLGYSTGSATGIKFGVGGIGPGTEYVRIFNNQLLTVDGNAGAPSQTFISNPNTGLYSFAANVLGFSEGGTGYRVGFRSIPRSTTATTLALTDIGRCVAVSAAINIPASVFAAGDAISVYNDSASAVNITISAGTLRLSGTTTTGTRSLSARGIATLWFNVGGATPEVIASGNIT